MTVAHLRLHRNLLSKFNLWTCSVNWSSGENRCGKTIIKEKTFVNRSRRNDEMINKNTLDKI